METRKNLEEGSSLAKNLGYPFCTGVPSRGQSGGLLLFWGSTINLQVYDFNKNMILAYLKHGRKNY